MGSPGGRNPGRAEIRGQTTHFRPFVLSCLGSLAFGRAFAAGAGGRGGSPGGGRSRWCRRAGLGDSQKATTELQEALKLNPDPAEAHYFLGVAYQRQGQPDKAAASFKAAFEHTPTGKLLSQIQMPEK